MTTFLGVVTWAALVVGFSISACGGRTSDDHDNGADPSDTTATPVPTCAEPPAIVESPKTLS